MPVFPITFTIHSSKITGYVPQKTELLSCIIPGNPYSFDNEDDYYNEYKQSIFAITCKKSGWDCMRHYEILACGCIPIFINLKDCPVSIMTHFPKELIIKSEELFNELKKLSIEDAASISRPLAEELIMYTQTHLTNHSMAEYVLNKSGFDKNNIGSVLVLSGCPTPDYMRCEILTGLKEIFRSECHDYPKIQHLYSDYDTSDKSLYGKGFSYSRLLDPSLRNNLYDRSIIDDIRKHKYELIIYGSFHRGTPFFDLVNTFYKPNEMIFICGEDTHECHYENILKMSPDYNVFVREFDCNLK